MFTHKIEVLEEYNTLHNSYFEIFLKKINMMHLFSTDYPNSL